MLRTIYINGKGYNPNSPDTLRLYVASYPVYTKVGAGTDFIPLDLANQAILLI